MSLYSIPNFVVAIYTLSLGIFVLYTNPKGRKNRLFFMLTLPTFTWLFSYGLAYSTENHDHAFFLGQIGHAAAVILTPLLYYFALEILGSYKKKTDAKLAAISLIAAIFAVLLVYISPLYFKSIVKRFWGYYPLGGPFMITYAVLTFAVAFRVIFVLVSASRTARKELKWNDYQRFKYYSLSVGIFMVASTDYLAKFDLEIYPFGYFFVGAFSSLITYAIVRHKLLDVDFIIRRSFVYSLLISVLTFIYLAIILISEYFFRSLLGYQSVLIALTGSSIIAFTFNPLRTRIQKFIDKRFLRIDPEKLIEENVQMKSELEKQDRLKAVATLAAGMAHEIKNPLTSIRTFAEYLPQKYDDPGFREKFKRIVVDEVDRVNNIVKQLLDFSKPQELDLRPVSITTLLDETLSLLNNNFLKNKIELVKNYGTHATLPVDKNQLKQAFLNIFLNSIQAMPHGGTLTVSVSLSSALRLLISVTDTGPGIPKENLPHIFDPFFTTREDGTGLGLSIVHGIIEKHGGKIKAESAPGTGTTILIRLKLT